MLKYSRSAIRVVSIDDPDRTERMNNLERTGPFKDLFESIEQAGREAAEAAGKVYEPTPKYDIKNAFLAEVYWQNKHEEKEPEKATGAFAFVGWAVFHEEGNEFAKQHEILKQQIAEAFELPVLHYPDDFAEGALIAEPFA